MYCHSASHNIKTNIVVSTGVLLKKSPKFCSLNQYLKEKNLIISFLYLNSLKQKNQVAEKVLNKHLSWLIHIKIINRTLVESFFNTNRLDA